MRLRACFVDGDKVFLAMDLMDLHGSGTLLKLQQESRRKATAAELQASPSAGHGLPEAIVCHVARQTATGLQSLHTQSLMHRDLKPENILVSSTGEVRIADFGLSKSVCENEGLSIQHSPSFVGTQGYMSPQRAAGSMRLDLGEDIWAIGLVFYELSVGHHPLEAQGARRHSTAEIFGTLWEKVDAEGGLELPKPAEEGVRQEFTNDLRDMVRGCLRREPSDRLSAQALWRHTFLRSGDVAEDAACQRSWGQWFEEVGGMRAASRILNET